MAQDKGKGSTFGRSLMQYIAQRLPYSTSQVLDDVSEYNPKYKHFYSAGTRREESLARHSVSQMTSSDNEWAEGAVGVNTNYHSFMYANVDFDKAKRLRDYRIMAAFAEVSDALDEICDDIIVTDDKGNVIDLMFKEDVDLSNLQKEELKKEFKTFINHFNLETKGWEIFRKLLVDGEIFFEHIIHEEHPEAGVLGTVEVPTEIIDPIFDNIQNNLIKGHLLRRPVMNPNTNTIEKMEYIPFDKNQMTYIHSGIWNEDKTLRLPFVENCRRAYRQLSLIEDAIVIYRLVRAPERLVFNVDVGNMSPPKAEAYLKKLMHNYFSKKTYDKAQGSSVNSFNPQSMLDSFWFAKRQGSEGTNVSQLAGGANLGELTDLMYFVKKLYKSLRVPTNRLEVESTYQEGTSILREELKFARFLIRLQTQVAQGFKNSFITHLKLKEMWDAYDLKENFFDPVFTPPSNFFALREQQLLELKSANFGNFANNESISNTYAMKKYLDWSDQQIKQNREWLKKDAQLTWEIGQIATNGPNWREVLQQGMEPGGDMGGMGGGMPMGDLGGFPGEGGALPEFGGEADVPGELPPEGGGGEGLPA
jgi:hypothetical protein